MQKGKIYMWTDGMITLTSKEVLDCIIAPEVLRVFSSSLRKFVSDRRTIEVLKSNGYLKEWTRTC